MSNEETNSGYTNEQIANFVNGYLKVGESLWDYIPIGAHVRYFRKNRPGDNYGKNELFRKGGFLIGHGVNPRTDEEYFNISLAYVPAERISLVVRDPAKFYILKRVDIDTLYKKYSYENYIENIHIIASLRQKNDIIAALDARIKRLELRK
jgi:hypothetical protein